MTDTPISRDDIEFKLRQVQDDVQSRTDSAKSTLIPAGIAGAILLLFLVYVLGKRVGTKRSAIVEIRRI